MKDVRLATIIISALFACSQPGAAPGKQKSHSADILHVPETRRQPDITNTVAVKDSSIYLRYVPSHVFDMIRQKLPGWRFMNPDSWEDIWFDMYQKDSSLVNYFSADFNCDGRNDFAVLLIDSKRDMVAWVLLSAKSGYDKFLLHELHTDRKPVDVGIELVPKGKLDYIDLNDESVKSIHIDCPGIQVLFFERAAVTYYWNKGKFDAVLTGD